MSNYQFATPGKVGDADNLLAQTVQVTLNSVPELARVFVRLFPVAGLAYDVELTGVGTYNYLSVSGARVFVEPLYNASYQAGTISGSVRAYTALLVEIDSEVFSDTVTVVANAAFPVDAVGTAGNDVLVGDAGSNRLLGRDGDDRLAGGAGADTIDGGNGIDTVDYSQSNAAVSVTIGGGVSGGDATGDTLISIEGAIGSGFGDTLTGDGSANTLDGGGGNDTLSGGGGDDVLLGGSGDDTIDGGSGNDRIDGGSGADTMTGGTGDDSYFVDSAGDQVVEGPNGGNDRVFAAVSYTLGAAAQVETLSTTANAGTAAIDLTGNGFAQSIFGNAGANVLRGGGGADSLSGFGGDDLYYVDADDLVYEGVGGGTDRVLASTSYVLRAGAEVERITTDDNFGTAAIDLTGNAFAQAIYGNDGANILDGKGGADDLIGFGGADIFAFTSTLGGGNIDTIYGFVSGTDRIALDDAVFAGLTPGALSAGAFVAGTAALDADDRILFDAATGGLWFDADGNGAGAAVQFAVLTNGATVTAADFSVI